MNRINSVSQYADSLYLLPETIEEPRLLQLFDVAVSKESRGGSILQRLGINQIHLRELLRHPLHCTRRNSGFPGEVLDDVKITLMQQLRVVDVEVLRDQLFGQTFVRRHELGSLRGGFDHADGDISIACSI